MGTFSHRVAVLLTVLIPVSITHVVAQDAGEGREFGAVISKVGNVRNSTALFAGGQGGWILDHHLAIGLGGYTLLNDVSARVPDTLGNRNLTFSYGGATFEYTYPSGDSFYAIFQMLLGGGAVGHKESPYIDRRQYQDPCFVVEPNVTLEVAVSKMFRIGVGAGYRQVLLLKSNLATSSDLSSISGSLSLKVGFF